MRLCLGQRSKRPENLLLSAAWNHQQKANHKVHALTVTNFWVECSVGLQYVSKGLLADGSNPFSHVKQWVRGVGATQVFIDIIEMLWSISFL